MKVKKRSGNVVQFDPEKIEKAVSKALEAKGLDGNPAVLITKKVVEEIEKTFDEVIDIEKIQDLVEKELMKQGYFDVAKAYIIYRQERASLRTAKKVILGVEKDETKLPINALEVLKSRYLLKDSDGNLKESPSEMFERVAKYVASAEEKPGHWREKFYEIMKERTFLPNSPTLMNAGTDFPQLSACFVIPVEDSIEDIFDAVKHAALIHKTGGGTGFSFSRLRPSNDEVRSTGGIASGPVSFMRVFDVATEVIKQGGKRRGANMGVLRVDHPDIVSFITSKTTDGQFSNFNISVALTDSFLEAVKKNGNYPLINPRNGKETAKADAYEIFQLIVSKAWERGDPGILFIDRINQLHTLKGLGPIESTNPCGEQPLLPNEACNLGSINLSKFVKNKSVNWDYLGEIVSLCVRFLDDVIDVSKFPLPIIENTVKMNRKIGLGLMGFADYLVSLGIRYDSKEAENAAEEVMKFINTQADMTSKELAQEKGAFPNFSFSEMAKRGEKPRRNATLTTIAPTGSISIIAGTSSGIEPFFDLVFIRNVLDGTQFLEINEQLSQSLQKEGLDEKYIISRISEGEKLKDIDKVPEKLKSLFVTAHDIDPVWHVKIQAAFQKYTDNAVSKTVNFANSATRKQIEEVYLNAYDFGCKGITIYRDGSKNSQVLVKPRDKVCRLKTVDSEYSGGCEECGG